MERASVFSRRLKEARKSRRLSQERLGVLAGIDEFSASARMNQYERGKHLPDLGTIDRIAAALDVPFEFFFADDDRVAALLSAFHVLDGEAKQHVIDYAQGLASLEVSTSSAGTVEK